MFPMNEQMVAAEVAYRRERIIDDWSPRPRRRFGRIRRRAGARVAIVGDGAPRACAA